MPVVAFHVSAPSPPLSVFIFFCQSIVSTFRLQSFLYSFVVDEIGGFACVLLRVMLALCGFRNSDFLRPLVPPFCLIPNMKSLHAFALEAFYPLILIMIAFIFVKLHDHNFRPVVLLCKPLQQCFVYFRRHWDSVCCQATVSEQEWHPAKCQPCFFTAILLWSSSVKTIYHLQSSVSFCVGLVFIAFLTYLLILYPTRIFRKCIACLLWI